MSSAMPNIYSLLFLKNNFLIISYLYNLNSLLPNACNIEQKQNIFLILIGIISIYMNLERLASLWFSVFLLQLWYVFIYSGLILMPFTKI